MPHAISGTRVAGAGRVRVRKPIRSRPRRHGWSLLAVTFRVEPARSAVELADGTRRRHPTNAHPESTAGAGGALAGVRSSPDRSSSPCCRSSASPRCSSAPGSTRTSRTTGSTSSSSGIVGGDGVPPRLRGRRGGEPPRRRPRPAALARVHGDRRLPGAPRARDARDPVRRRSAAASRSRSRSGSW